jgi:hypothetical protein
MKQKTNMQWVDWMELPPVIWNASLTEHADTDWASLEAKLNSAACTCAMLAAYIETRKGTDGCGPKVHSDGVRAAKRMRVRVRRALRYTDPAAGTFDF